MKMTTHAKMPMTNIEMNAGMSFINWEFSQEIPASTFQFKPPPGAKPKSKSKANQSTTTHPKMAKEWSVPGKWTGVDFDADSGIIYALGDSGKCAEIEPQGEVKRTFSLGGEGNIMRLAQLNDSKNPEIIISGTWGDAVSAFTSDGKELWSYSTDNGVDDVWPGDLNGDGRDEVIVGYNGGTGLHALSSDGKVLWKYQEIGNVWHVCVGNVIGDAALEVLSTSAVGKVYIFDTSGTLVKSSNPGFYANMVRLAETSDTVSQIIAMGTANPAEIMAAIDTNGNQLWKTTLAASEGHVVSAVASPDGKYIAIGMGSGDVYVANTKTGKIIGEANNQGRAPQVSWAEKSAGKPALLIVVATGDSLNAFRVKPLP